MHDVIDVGGEHDVATAPLEEFEPELDQHVVLRGMRWKDFETLLAMRGDRAGGRMYYLDGENRALHDALKKRQTMG